MTTLDKIEEIKVILELVSRDNVFLLEKVDKLKQDIVNNLKVTYEKV